MSKFWPQWYKETFGLRGGPVERVTHWTVVSGLGLRTPNRVSEGRGSRIVI